MERTILHIKKKDTVQIMSGKERGKTGKVLRVNHKTGRVFVEKLNMIKRHKKPSGTAPGGIVEAEGSLAASVLLLFCDKCNRGVRTSRKVLESGKKVRVCRKCNGQLDK
jgi:large subunit ribosomal protein L24